MYVGFNAEVPRDQLRSAIRNRDQIWQDDRVAVCIDTFGDGRYMICLGSNANNIQFDLKFATDDIDTSYDVNYENKTQLTEKGYDVELKIDNNKIIFPAEKAKAKKLLQYLNEELYKGVITEKVYETNSKREAEA